jgi:hypothetical protein
MYRERCWWVLVLKVDQSDNLYLATRVHVMYNVYVKGEMLVVFLLVLKVNQSDNLYLATRVSVMYNVYV